MNPQCARCGKVVYPTEKVNCLDKVLLRRGEKGRAGGPVGGEAAGRLAAGGPHHTGDCRSSAPPPLISAGRAAVAVSPC